MVVVDVVKYNRIVLSVVVAVAVEYNGIVLSGVVAVVVGVVEYKLTVAAAVV